VNLTLSLKPEVEKGLIARAQELGISLDDYVQEIVTREAGLSASPPSSIAENLSDLLLNSPFAGADLNLERAQDYPRSTEME
jgi:hypothetical protein